MNQIIGALLIVSGIAILVGAYIKYMNKKFEKYVEAITQAGQRELDSITRETSELTLRDRSGKLFSVKIIVDHNLDPNLSPEDLSFLVKNKEAGSISSMLDGEPINPEVGEVKEFVFSAKAVAGMREAGLELDAVVVSMLRAAGKVA